MNSQTQAGAHDGGGAATPGKPRKPASPPRPARIGHLHPPKIKASAEHMAEFLESYAKELLQLAEQLRCKEAHETVSIPWPPHMVVMDCNGGGDGGGGGE